VASAFLRNGEAHEVVVVIWLETGRVFVVHKFNGRLNPAAGDREQDGRVSVDIPTDGNPVKWRLQTVVCPCLENLKDQ
jgi:hypothetical protein